ncbi:hypothetical protein [Aliirhizobium smilacinae]|uniref:Uncharacterized protein n=1 Tax=Aliirhizobium smilacinae TaxID=1395944 RepID=A0A5C4XJ23_9HYPH|nr:hypothetical protein [Rhizobium smilacinae]TNM62941.1 hypothetical protein FHP24_17135 [Rhizobium smilacinae]
MEAETKVKAGVSTVFEDTIVEIDAGLKAVVAAGADLLAAIPKAASMIQPLDGEAFAELGALRLALLVQQKSAYGALASHVARIGAVVDDERAVFDSRENPQVSDVLLGFFSKKSMRRRIERRAARAGGIERLRTVLGRADRLVGRIEVHRQAVTRQRVLAEEVLALLTARKAPQEVKAFQAEGGGETKAAREPAFASMIGLIDTVARTFNGGVRDLNLLMQKLGLDIENLLDLYSVLLSFDREREAHFLSPDAYPHLAQSVWRLANDLLPGARLNRSRQMIDLAFERRFEDS